jgi:hypothetical protein
MNPQDLKGKNLPQAIFSSVQRSMSKVADETNPDGDLRRGSHTETFEVVAI